MKFAEVQCAKCHHLFTIWQEFRGQNIPREPWCETCIANELARRAREADSRLTRERKPEKIQC